MRDGPEGLKGEGQRVKGAWDHTLHVIKDEIKNEKHTYPKAADLHCLVLKKKNHVFSC